MAARDENTDASRTSRPKERGECMTPVPPHTGTLWDEAKRDRAEGRVSTGTRGAADIR